MENYKVYVEVTVKFSTDSVMMPVEFIWEDALIVKVVVSKNIYFFIRAGYQILFCT